MGRGHNRLDEVISAQHELERKLKAEEDEEKRYQLIEQHIQIFDIEKSLIIPEFKSDMQWLNTNRPLTLCKDFVGKITVLDFFTYCCINCMHILPDLEFIEKEYPPQKGVNVVGVHSAKFENEKSLENVASAILRHNIGHPVVNDPNGYLWSNLSIMCWPTLLILGPSAQVLFIFIGEGNRRQLQLYVECCIKFYSQKNQLSFRSLPLDLLSSTKPDSLLLFPSKVARCPDDGRLAISDSGHHRILILSAEGLVLEEIGGPDAGFVNDSFEKARFCSPQGLAWKNKNLLFVADTENHAIRQVCMTTRTVSTLAGTGEQGHDLVGGKQGLQQTLSSPWDLCIGAWNSEGIGREVLLIAMAGTHQIWSYALENSEMLNGKILEKGICLRMVGSGNEENRNNTYANKASFAQPSGLCIARSSSGNARLIVADSESSTIRMVDFQSWAVQGIAGGSRDPTDLFQFGDVDGIGIDARLQHPLGVCWSFNNKIIYIADSYNHKIKHIDLLTKKCETYAGTGKRGHSCGSLTHGEVRFNEPGGICISNDETTLYIADTNNHCIKVVNIENKMVSELPIIRANNVAVSLEVADSEDCVDRPVKKVAKHKPHEIVALEPIFATAEVSIALSVEFSLGSGLTMNVEAPNSWNLHLIRDDELTDLKCSGKINAVSCTVECRTHLPHTAFDSASHHLLELECTLYICDAKGLCHMRIVAFRAKIEHSDAVEGVQRIIQHLVTID